MKIKKYLSLATLLLSIGIYSCSKEDNKITPETTTQTYTPRLSNDTSSAYISQVLDYTPAPGQFINTSIGTDTSAKGIIGKPVSNMISLGAFGGYVIFQFDHSIQDTTGADLAIYGNPYNGWSEPGIVLVSYDANNNGIADDSWYELAGSNYDSTTTIKNYSVTYYNPNKYANVPWKDNQGNKDSVLVNAFHLQNYYPLFANNQDSITFTGSLLPKTITTNGFVKNLGFSWGYSDSYSTGLDPNGYDNYSKNQYNSFDIGWARDSSGKSITLKYIDFVKVYTGQLANGGSLGEVSTEVKGAADLHILNK
ncbi:PKD domain-containing protein [Rhizosphaericola mali]|uniref:PKD domain-containing protein n=1 Tax=Rhizosphaericola mali TaxID=2545455 RepID=A0A5P2G0X4_9BACT|nr:PKD domain-containing protein [Rhizosphaericola mali]QES87492.1 PKD domain-containing protein [Rhizosphaericola mali]